MMRRPTLSLIVLVLALALFSLIPTALSEEKGEKETPDPTLQALQLEIEKILKQHTPKAKVEFDRGALVVDNHTRTFIVYSINKGGVVSDATHQQVVPDYDGILLRLSVLPGTKYAGSRVVPQTYREPYWITYINAYPIKDKDEHVFISLSYGFRPDEKLVDAIKAAVAKVEK